MQVVSEKRGEIVVLEVSGKLRGVEALRLGEVCRRCMERGSQSLIFDLSETRSVDSLGQEVLAQCLRMGVRLLLVSGLNFNLDGLILNLGLSRSQVFLSIQDAVLAATEAPLAA